METRLYLNAALSELWLYGYIGDMGNTMPELRELLQRQPDTLTVRIHSPGGDVMEGYAIADLFDAYKASGGTLAVMIDGTCASMATLIALRASAGQLQAAQNARWMIHRPTTLFAGNPDQQKAAYEFSKKVEEDMVRDYAQHTGRDQRTIRKWMEQEKWFVGQEMVDAGWVDALVEPQLEMAAALADGATAHDAFQAYDFPATTPKRQPDQSPNGMDIKTIATALSLDPQQTSEAQIIAKVNELQQAKQQAETELKAAQDAKAAAEQKLREQEAAAHQQKCEALVDGAVQQGKITKAQREHYLKLAQADFASTEAILKQMQAYQPVTDQAQPEPGESGSEDGAAKHHLPTMTERRAQIQANLKNKS